MALSKKGAQAALFGLVGIVAMASTPLFDKDDLTQPMSVASKMKYDQGVQYGLGYASAMAGLIGISYLAATGRLTKSDE